MAPYRQALVRVESSCPQSAQLQEQVEQLTLALETNRVIGAAVGILMERFHLSRAAAFASLKRMSQETGTRMFDLAGTLVVGAESRGATTG